MGPGEGGDGRTLSFLAVLVGPDVRGAGCA